MQKLFSNFSRDFAASIVVFLVAIPLCLGIAIASGVPVVMGLISGIIGGIVVGSIAGSPLQVTGPAAGLAVIVFGFVQEYGIALLGPVLVLAGLMQIAAGTLRLGSWFRLISPAVVLGMLTGIGILIILGQIHVLMGSVPAAHATENLAAMDDAVSQLWSSQVSVEAMALLVGLVSLLSILIWDKTKPQSLALVPGALIGVFVGTLLTAIMNLPIPRVEVPASLFEGLTLPTAASFAELAAPGPLIAAAVIAVIASAETLLSASAVDRMHDGPRTRLNKELIAQGVGNGLSGLLGGLPLTGVIVRSSANVQAGAKTRVSAILHGVWILALVALIPSILGLVPLTALAAVLLVTGWKLIGLQQIRDLLNRYGVLPLAIWGATMTTVVLHDLLIGVAVGIAISLVEVVPYIRRRFSVTCRQQDDGIELSLTGAVTCKDVPKLLEALEGLPDDQAIRLNARRLRFVDHTSAETITDWIRRQTKAGRRIEITPPRDAQPLLGRIVQQFTTAAV